VAPKLIDALLITSITENGLGQLAFGSGRREHSRPPAIDFERDGAEIAQRCGGTIS